MPIPIPELNDRDFESLMSEARALIPRYNAKWTNYNPSDPGITLLELFAFLCEQTLYRVNRVPIENFEAFLKLLGISLADGESIESGILRARALLDVRYRTITPADYQSIVLEKMEELLTGLGGRAIVMNNVDLEFAPPTIVDLASISKEAHVSVIIVPRCDTDDGTYCDADSLPLPVPTTTLLGEVSTRLQERRLIGMRAHAVAPRYRTLNLEAWLVPEPDFQGDIVQTVQDSAKTFYDPLDGGPDGTGWPLGRDVYRSEFFQILEGTPGVDFVQRIAMNSADADVAVQPWELVNLASITVNLVDANVTL